LSWPATYPLYGPEGAAHVFSPQKGATPDMVDELDRRARHFAELSARRMGWDASTLPGAGAAGGLGYAFLQYLQATMESGADLLLDLAGFDHLLKHADLVITGEGHADRQTLMGKLPERVMRRARQQGIPVWLIAGQADDTASLLQAGFSRVSSLTPAGMPLKEAIRPETARKNILRWVERNWSY
jgi:glycerate kinase